ncbi:carbonic anhydrase family protein [Priestia megaterium]|nr:carbonic anhydrase family protein [Priestia megaterium]
MKTRVVIFPMLIAGMLASGCSSNDVVKEKSEVKESGEHAQHKSEQIEYGHFQSPIDILSDEAVPMDDDGTINLNYNDSFVSVEDNGHTIEVKDDDGTALINGRKFSLAQFHFHASSEHTVDRENYEMELHFVNKSQSGRIAVIGVFLTAGAENPAFQTILNNIKKGKEAPLTETTKIDVKQLVPQEKSYYHYLGSLTTPPYTENVEWYVMRNPVEVSRAQIDKFRTHYPDNHREVQSLDDRTILEKKW